MRVFLGMATMLAAFATAAQPTAPNLVVISPNLETSGQPSRAFLETLKARGFEVVLYLAPPTVSDAIAEEPLIVGRQGLVYVNIPIPFDSPGAAHFDAVSRTLRAYSGRKVYVHCQANFRASSMVFLHRVIDLKEPPEAAYEAVKSAWIPNRTWKAFIAETLKANRVAFDPL